MTPSEFRVWFDVFCEAVDGTPTPKQWAKIKMKVDMIERVQIGVSNAGYSQQAGLSHIFQQAGN